MRVMAMCIFVLLLLAGGCIGDFVHADESDAELAANYFFQFRDRAAKFAPDNDFDVYRAKKQANPIDAQVGNRVRIRRMLIGMSQEKLGDLLGLTFQQVQKYEKGVNRIGAGRLFEISRILGVPIDFFYEGVAAAPADGSSRNARRR